MTDVARRPGPAADLVMGRYRLDSLLGTGGSAEVWRGHDERLARPVAIKILHAHLLRDPEARRRFEREARAAATLSHPGIVTIYDVGVTDTTAAIVLEFVDGETLASRLEREVRIPPGEVARIGAELADALAHAHGRGVVHRDVKPGNVLIDRDGRARLTDFGIARILDAEDTQITSAGAVSGTLRYLAPEQLAGGEATPASDLYALGVLLYEMTAGRPPYGATTPVALAAAQHLPIEPPSDAPPALAAILTKALDPDPAGRPASAAEMADGLRKAGASLAAPAGPPRTANRDDPTVAIPVPTPTALGRHAQPPAEAEWPLEAPPRRSLAPWAAAALAVAGVVLAVFLVAGLGGQVGPRSGGSAAATSSPATTPAMTAAPTPPPAVPSANGGGKGKAKGHGP